MLGALTVAERVAGLEWLERDLSAIDQVHREVVIIYDIFVVGQVCVQNPITHHSAVVGGVPVPLFLSVDFVVKRVGLENTTTMALGCDKGIGL